MAAAPPLPPDLEPRLREGAAALGAPLDDGQASRLLSYLALVTKWNRVYNLTAVRDPAAMLVQHLLDSLSVIRPLVRHQGSGPFRLLDVGSGAGLPGVVIALVLPEAEVTCVDTVGKKASFIQQVAAELGLRNLRSEHARVEQLAPKQAEVVTSRAFASLADFVELTRPHLKEGGVWMAMKGKAPTDELAALPADVEVLGVEPLRVPELAAERCLVWMRPILS
jgi:16S rRNA (guanine527-N7)-methyltransferase